MHPAAPDSPALIAQQANPIVVGDTLYSLGQNNKVFALDAATGKPRWVHRSTEQGVPTRRGVVYWESPDRKDRRILFTIGPQLIALDAATGTPIPSFGKNGKVVMYVDRDSPYRVGAASPGIVFEDLLVMGSVVGEGYRTPPGNIRAYDVRTGALRWVFRTVPHPGEFGHETWAPESWKHNGGANVWGSFSLDVKRGIVFAPTGSPTYNFYGADRPGQNLFANCVLALDARTGKRLWHFQAVHHDLWAYDLTAQPVLASIAPQGQEGGRGGAGDETRPRVRAGPGDRQAGVPGARTTGAQVRRARRKGLAHPAVPDAARARGPPGRAGRGPDRVPRSKGTPGDPRAAARPRATRGSSPRLPCVEPSRCPATTADHCGAAAPSIPRPACCT